MKYSHEPIRIACALMVVVATGCSTKHGTSKSKPAAGSGGKPAAVSDAAVAADASGAAADAGQLDAVQPTAAVDAGAPAERDAAVPAADASMAQDAAMMTEPPGRGPYFTSGPWHGYFWTAQHGDGTTLSTTNYEAPEFQSPLCMRGVVTTSADNSSNALLGVNLSQGKADDVLPQTVTPTRAGLLIEVKNNAGSPLRVQVQTPDGATNDRDRWCAVVSGSGGFIPWSQFNTACWDNSGMPYAREPISGAMLLVPGTSAAPVPYDVCLLKLAEADAPEQ